MLAGIYAHDELADNWVFKGGTCLKKCFFETYRFSEDLDFTLLNEAHIEEAFLKRVFGEIGAWIYEQTGIEIPPDGQEFEIYENPRGRKSCQGKISYRGPVSPTRPLPRMKLDLTADERVVLPPAAVDIFHPYSDAPEEGIEVLSYDYVEAFAEKFRALSERTRPRDLYDVVNLYRNEEARPEREQFINVLREKCAFKGIELPRLIDLEPQREALVGAWSPMLDHQLPVPVPVVGFWEVLPKIFAWLFGQRPTPALPAMPIGGTDVIIRDRIVGLSSGSRGQSLIDTIRFAAANRFLVHLEYVDKAGKRSTRPIEAYSLRRSQAGDVLLMAVRADNGQPRSYLVNSIVGATPTQTIFSPRYPIELTPFGPQSVPATSRSTSPGLRGISTRGISRRRASGSGPAYVYRCTACGKLFYRKTQDSTLRPHKKPSGYACHGTYGIYVRTKY